MCGRYALSLNANSLSEIFTSDDSLNYPPSFNIAPTQKSPIIVLGKEGQRRIMMARWGLLPDWMDNDPTNGPLFNACGETINQKKSFISPFQKRRCLIPADGFYEWQRDGNMRTPYYFKRNDKSPMAFAGLWELKRIVFEDKIDMLISFTIITTSASSEFSNIHDRMPVILEPSSWQMWLDKDSPTTRLERMFEAPSIGLINAHKVSDRVNKVVNNDAELTLQLT